MSWTLQLDRALDDVLNSGLEFDCSRLRPAAWGWPRTPLTIDRDGKRLEHRSRRASGGARARGDVRSASCASPVHHNLVGPACAVLLAGHVDAGARKASLRLRLPEGATVRPSVAAASAGPVDAIVAAQALVAWTAGPST
ncbi:MAG: hypothetical protein U0168_13960 [Nannocystaceae bacterium]